MSVSFASVGGGTKITIQNPDLGDKLDLDPHQVVQPKASGGFYRFALAAVTDTLRELKWSNLRLSELNDLISFFNTVAQGAVNEFTFTDERGVKWAAYFLNPTLEPVTVADEATAEGTFESNGVSIPTTTRAKGFYSLSAKLHLVLGTATTERATTWPPTTAMPTAHHTAAPTGAETTAPPAPEFIITAAGTPEAIGDYFTDTEYAASGCLCYRKSGGGAYIFSDVSHRSWYSGPRFGSPDDAWYYGVALASSPAHTPFACNTGASPAPAVAVG
jgi:hypothetical protein